MDQFDAMLLDISHFIVAAQIDLICHASNAILSSKIKVVWFCLFAGRWWCHRMHFPNDDDKMDILITLNIIWNSSCRRQKPSNDSISLHWYESLFTFFFIADIIRPSILRHRFYLRKKSEWWNMIEDSHFDRIRILQIHISSTPSTHSISMQSKFQLNLTVDSVRKMRRERMQFQS